MRTPPQSSNPMLPPQYYHTQFAVLLQLYLSIQPLLIFDGAGDSFFHWNTSVNWIQ